MSDTTVPAKQATPPAPPATRTQTATAEPQKLDDVLLAMDVVDTIRHREQTASFEANAELREQQLIDRLKEIYDAQGIEVPDRILKDGVKALEEHRFTYKPPDPNRLGVKLAKAYVNRRKWLPQTVAVTGLIVAAVAAWQFFYVIPRAAEWNALPAEITRLSTEGQALAVDPAVDTQIAGVAASGQSAWTNNRRGDAIDARDMLRGYTAQLTQQYDVRIVNRDGQDSGFYREAQSGQRGRNYYVVVEAVAPGGRVLKLPVVNIETRKSKELTEWAVRVPQEVYNSVRDDKTDNGIIDKAVIGAKSVGQLEPLYTVAVSGGTLTEW